MLSTQGLESKAANGADVGLVSDVIDLLGQVQRLQQEKSAVEVHAQSLSAAEQRALAASQEAAVSQQQLTDLRMEQDQLNNDFQAAESHKAMLQSTLQKDAEKHQQEVRGLSDQVNQLQAQKQTLEEQLSEDRDKEQQREAELQRIRDNQQAAVQEELQHARTSARAEEARKRERAEMTCQQLYNDCQAKTAELEHNTSQLDQVTAEHSGALAEVDSRKSEIRSLQAQVNELKEYRLQVVGLEKQLEAYTHSRKRKLMTLKGPTPATP